MNSKSVIRGYNYAREYHKEKGKFPNVEEMGKDFRYGAKMFESDFKKGVVKLSTKS